MALNWVMVADATTSSHSQSSSTSQGFVPLPSERTFFTSSHRTSLSLTTHKSTYPAHSPNIAITSSDGTLYLTNQRIVYLPTKSSTISCNVAQFESFSCPVLNLHDTHLVLPWFGPNSWTAQLQPVAGGGLPNSSAAIELKFTFKEGGAPDFQSRFETIKERLQQVAERDGTSASSRRPNGVDVANVHLDELPSYQDSGHDRIAPDSAQSPADEQVRVPNNATADQVRAMAAAAATRRDQEAMRRRSQEEQDAAETPIEAPPGYEEAQQQSIQTQLEWRQEQEQESASGRN